MQELYETYLNLCDEKDHTEELVLQIVENFKVFDQEDCEYISKEIVKEGLIDVFVEDTVNYYQYLKVIDESSNIFESTSSRIDILEQLSTIELDEEYLEEVSRALVTAAMRAAGGALKKVPAAARGVSSRTLAKKGYRPGGISSKGTPLSGASRRDDIERIASARRGRSQTPGRFLERQSNKRGEGITQGLQSLNAAQARATRPPGPKAPKYIQQLKSQKPSRVDTGSSFVQRGWNRDAAAKSAAVRAALPALISTGLMMGGNVSKTIATNFAPQAVSGGAEIAKLATRKALPMAQKGGKLVAQTAKSAAKSNPLELLTRAISPSSKKSSGALVSRSTPKASTSSDTPGAIVPRGSSKLSTDTTKIEPVRVRVEPSSPRALPAGKDKPGAIVPRGSSASSRRAAADVKRGSAAIGGGPSGTTRVGRPGGGSKPSTSTGLIGTRNVYSNGNPLNNPDIAPMPKWGDTSNFMKGGSRTSRKSGAASTANPGPSMSNVSNMPKSSGSGSGSGLVSGGAGAGGRGGRRGLAALGLGAGALAAAAALTGDRNIQQAKTSGDTRGTEPRPQSSVRFNPSRRAGELEPTARPTTSKPKSGDSSTAAEFDKAFASARKKQGSKGQFSFRGKQYHTEYDTERGVKEDKEIDVFDVIFEHLLIEGQAETMQEAVKIMEVMNHTEIKEILNQYYS
jgi:hypothetical protein